MLKERERERGGGLASFLCIFNFYFLFLLKNVASSKPCVAVFFYTSGIFYKIIYYYSVIDGIIPATRDRNSDFLKQKNPILTVDVLRYVIEK